MQSTIIQFSFIHTFIFTLNLLREEYTNKEEEEGKKRINGLDWSVRWSEELSFRANHRNKQKQQWQLIIVFLTYSLDPECWSNQELSPGQVYPWVCYSTPWIKQTVTYCPLLLCTIQLPQPLLSTKLLVNILHLTGHKK